MKTGIVAEAAAFLATGEIPTAGPTSNPIVASVLAGLLNRANLAAQLGRSERTVIRWEHAGLPPRE